MPLWIQVTGKLFITNRIRLTLTAGCFASPWEMSIPLNFRPISHAYLYSYFLPQAHWWLSFRWLLMSESLRPHGLQHASLSCSSQPPGVCSNSYPLSRWCHPIISSTVIPFSCPQSSPAAGSFPVSLLFASGGQSIGVSASASVLPMNIQGWFPLVLTGLISLLSKGLFQEPSSPSPYYQQKK